MHSPTPATLRYRHRPRPPYCRCKQLIECQAAHQQCFIPDFMLWESTREPRKLGTSSQAHSQRGAWANVPLRWEDGKNVGLHHFQKIQYVLYTAVGIEERSSPSSPLKPRPYASASAHRSLPPVSVCVICFRTTPHPVHWFIV